MEPLTEVDPYSKYSGRSAAAIVSKYTLLLALIFSACWTCMPFGFGLESLVITIMLAGFTYFEFRVHSAFRDQKPEAPTLGFRNQLAFASFILAYGLYHAFLPMEIPAEYKQFIDADTLKSVYTIIIGAYLTIGVVGFISQFCLAWYYRSAGNQRKV